MSSSNYDQENRPSKPDPPNPWPAARSLRDLADATVDFLEGKLQETPSHMGPPDSESASLIPMLVRMNRSGFMTTSSQPGLIAVPEGSAQRAYVEGFCNEETAYKIQTALLYEELVVITFAPDCESDSSIAVTIDDGQPFTFLGRWSVEEFNFYRNGNPRLDMALDAALCLQVFDPVWGRNDRLWDTLCRALST